MGITISSKRYGCDMGYGGFSRFRDLVSEKVSEKFNTHYMKLNSLDAMFLIGDARKEYFREYDAITNFLYQSDCEGSIDRNQAKQIYELIKDCDDEIIFGYIGRKDCAKMRDMKSIFSDKTKVSWN